MLFIIACYRSRSSYLELSDLLLCLLSLPALALPCILLGRQLLLQRCYLLCSRRAFLCIPQCSLHKSINIIEMSFADCLEVHTKGTPAVVRQWEHLSSVNL